LTNIQFEWATKQWVTYMNFNLYDSLICILQQKTEVLGEKARERKCQKLAVQRITEEEEEEEEDRMGSRTRMKTKKKNKNK